MFDPQINISVKASELQTELKKIIKSPHSELIAQVIIGNLNKTPEGLGQFFKSLSGITNELHWKVGMDVLIKKTALYSSKIDWEATIEQGLCHQELVKARITEIDLYQYAQVQIEFNIIDTSGVGVLSNQYVQEGYLLEGDEWPE